MTGFRTRGPVCDHLFFFRCLQIQGTLELEVLYAGWKSCTAHGDMGNSVATISFGMGARVRLWRETDGIMYESVECDWWDST